MASFSLQEESLHRWGNREGPSKEDSNNFEHWTLDLDVVISRTYLSQCKWNLTTLPCEERMNTLMLLLLTYFFSCCCFTFRGTICMSQVEPELMKWRHPCAIRHRDDQKQRRCMAAAAWHAWFMGFTMRLLDNAQCCIHSFETKARVIFTDPAVSLICVRSQSKVAAALNFQSGKEYCPELWAWESALGEVWGDAG